MSEALPQNDCCVARRQRSLDRSKKISNWISRAGCHFAAAIGLREQLEGYVPAIPGFANDQHTIAGRKMGRGLDHFREEGAQLIPPPTGDDPFVEEAYRLWALKQRSK